MIRPFRTSDTQQLLHVWYQASLIAHSFLDADFFEAERKRIVEHWLPQAETYVSVESRQLVGFLSLVGDEVGAIFVDPQAQGNGHGRALMDHARSIRDHLELDVFEENSIGRSFYAAHGFEQIGRGVDATTGRVTLRYRLG